MNLSLTVPIISVLSALLMKRSPEVKPFEHQLQGLITNKQRGKPLSDDYLQWVKGAEEAITDQKGEFRFVTWKKLPLTLHIYNNDQEVRVIVTNPSEFIKIKL